MHCSLSLWSWSATRTKGGEVSVAQMTMRPGAYVLDAIHSGRGFAIRHNGVSTFRGQFDDALPVDGVLIGTARVEPIKPGTPDLPTELASPAFFTLWETPTVALRSIDIRVATDPAADVDGELTIRARTQPLTATVRNRVGLGLGGPVVGFDLSTIVDRRGFGLVCQAAHQPVPGSKEVI
jgi:polyisoprenoid-binding protein YceI